MSNKLNIILAAGLIACGLTLVNARYQSRQLDIDWSQLQLDQSTLGKNERIEQIARTELNMTPLTPARTQYLTEGAQ